MVAAVEEGGSAVGDEQEDCVQREENECNIVDDSYSPNKVADRNAGVNSHDSNNDSDDSEVGNEEGELHMAMRDYDGDDSDNCDSSDSYSDESDKGNNSVNGYYDVNDVDFECTDSNEHDKDDEDGGMDAKSNPGSGTDAYSEDLLNSD